MKPLPPVVWWTVTVFVVVIMAILFASMLAGEPTLGFTEDGTF